MIRSMRKCFQSNYLTLQMTEKVSLRRTDDNTAIQVRQYSIKWSQQAEYTQRVSINANGRSIMPDENFMQSENFCFPPNYFFIFTSFMIFGVIFKW